MNEHITSILLTRNARPLFALNALIPLKFRGTYAVLTAPPNPPLLLTKLLKKEKGAMRLCTLDKFNRPVLVPVLNLTLILTAKLYNDQTISKYQEVVTVMLSLIRRTVTVRRLIETQHARS